MTEARSGAAAATVPWRRLTLLPALDGVRGVAVLLVVVTHLKLLVPYEVTGIGWVDDLIDGSYLGVDLFFVLSGFLITALLLNELTTTRTVRFGAFYARRALRLLPALYVLLAAHALYAWIAELSWLQEWATIRSALLYVSNWQLVFRPLTGVPDLGLLWSLAIEEQFYLLWPAILVTFLGPRERPAKVAAILVVAIVAVAVWRAHLWSVGVFWAQIAVRTDARVDGLLIGALLASMWVRGIVPKRGVNEAAWAGLTVIVVCLATFDITTGIGYKGGLTVFSVAGAAVILGLLEGRWGGRHLFAFAPLRALGRVSYGVYLWHYPIFYAVSVQGEQWTNLQRVVVAVSLTVAATLGSWYLVERPALALKGRFRVDRPGPVPGSSEGATAWDSVSRPPVGTALSRNVMLAAAIGTVLLLGLVARFTVFVGDPEEVAGLPQPEGLDFPSGDVDRSGYWSLVDLEPTAEDSFDRDADPTSLGTADTGQPWEVVVGEWGVRTDAAVVSGDPTGDPRLALLPQVVNDGLVEVTLRVAAAGTGLVFRFEDPQNYWAVTAEPESVTWAVTQVIDGQAGDAGRFSGPVFDGVTITVTQNLDTVRFLIDGVEYYRLLSPPPERVARSGLVAEGPLSGGGRWDRFLSMAPRADLEGG